jgi:integrase
MSKTLKDLRPGGYKGLGGGVFAYRGKKPPHKIRYGIQWTEDGQVKREMIPGTVTLTKARDLLTKRQGDVVAGRFGLAKKKRAVPFTTYSKEYQERHSKEGIKRSWKRDELSLKWLKQFFNSKALHLITSDDVNRYRAWRKKSVSGSTVNRELSLLRHMFNQAIPSGLVDHNPVNASAVKPFAENNRKCWHIVTAAQEKALIAAAAPHLKPLITVAIETGMRAGELFALDWRKVNLKERLIQVVTGSSGDTKSGKARWVPITDAAHTALRKLNPRPAGPVFAYQGEPLQRVTRSWYRACREAKIKARFHDLRHTACTRMISAGIPVPRVQQIAGHSSILTTMQYVHLDPRQADDVRAAMAAYRDTQSTVANSEPGEKCRYSADGTKVENGRVRKLLK